MNAEEPKLRGTVREIGLTHTGEHYGSFSVTISINVKTEGKVNYEAAEKLANKYKREYLGKEVEFLSVNLPCPVCGKILNSEIGLKGHIRQTHPERLDLISSPKVDFKEIKTSKPGKTDAKETLKKTKRRATEQKNGKPDKRKKSKTVSTSTSKKVKIDKPTLKKKSRSVVIAENSRLLKKSSEKREIPKNKNLETKTQKGKQLKLD